MAGCYGNPRKALAATVAVSDRIPHKWCSLSVGQAGLSMFSVANQAIGCTALKPLKANTLWAMVCSHLTAVSCTLQPIVMNPGKVLLRCTIANAAINEPTLLS